MSDQKADGRREMMIRLAITATITIAITVGVMLLSTLSGGFASDNHQAERRWTVPIAIHLTTVVPAFVIGGYLLIRPKGTRIHKALGRIYIALLLITATATIFIGEPGTGIMGSGFSFIHIFTLMAYVSVPYAIWAARTGRIQDHKDAMQGMYVGLCIAGIFAMLPGRLLQTAVF